MFRSISSFDSWARPGGWCCAAAVAAILSLSSCTAFHQANPGASAVKGLGCDLPADWSRDFRPRNSQSEFFGLSNRSRQIEQNCGIR